MNFSCRILVLALVLMAGTSAVAGALPSPLRERAAIVPLVDHHSHIVGPAASIRWPALAPAPVLPRDLARIVEERNRVAETGRFAELYTDSARILDVAAEAQPWVKGRDEVRRVVESLGSKARFTPQAFSVGDRVAHVEGVAIVSGPPELRANVVLGLRKDKSTGGVWRIETEQATPIPPPPFNVPMSGAGLVRDLDETGIERAVVLSTAYFFASPNRRWPGDEYENVRAENDWVAGEVAKYPQRLVMFCGVSPLADYAEEEIRRCARVHGVKGVKMHFRSSRVDVLEPGHLEKVKRVFRVCNELGLAIVVHTNVRPYGREQAEQFLKELLPEAPDVVVQIAHLWGGNEFRPEALAVFADAVAARDPRAKNLCFDLTEVAFAADEDSATWAEITRQIRRIGHDRVFYGSDAAAVPEAPPLSLRWAILRRAIPITNAELADIADNVAPYLRPALSPRDSAVKRELEARYAENAAAFHARDPERVMKLRHADFRSFPPNGAPMDRAQMRERTRSFIERVEKFDEILEEITSLSVSGDTARAVVDQSTRRQQRFPDGTLHEIRTSVTQRESWIRTREGWMLWRVDDVHGGYTLVDLMPPP